MTFAFQIAYLFFHSVLGLSSIGEEVIQEEGFQSEIPGLQVAKPGLCLRQKCPSHSLHALHSRSIIIATFLAKMYNAIMLPEKKSRKKCHCSVCFGLTTCSRNALN